MKIKPFLKATNLSGRIYVVAADFDHDGQFIVYAQHVSFKHGYGRVENYVVVKDNMTAREALALYNQRLLGKSLSSSSQI